MDGVISSLLFVIVNVVLLSSAQQQQKQQSLLPGNFTGLIQQSPILNGKTLWSPKLMLTDQIRSKKSYGGKKGNAFTDLNKKMKKWLKKNKEPKIEFDPDFIIIQDPPTPVYVQTFPANGSIPDDGCDSSSVRFEDGECYQLMGREPCGDPREYVTVDPVTFKGRCTLRLCGRDRVFVVRTGLCHDIYDKSECQGGRRLYYSPYGDPVCDCPIGEYPYPNPRDDCVKLFTQGPCPDGQVLTLDSDDRLSCSLSLCSAEYPIKDVYSPSYSNYKKSSPYGYNNYMKYPSEPKQLVPTSDGKCLELGSSAHCSDSNYYDDSQLVGFNILTKQLECVDITDPWSPYYSSPSENQLIDSVFNQLYPEYDFPIFLVYNPLHHANQLKYDDDKKKKKKKGGSYVKKSDSRQFSGTAINVPDNPPCRPGSGQGKCTSTIIPSNQPRPTKPAVKPGKAGSCPPNQFSNPRTGRCQAAIG